MTDRETERDVTAALVGLDLAVPGETPTFHRLTGGVASDIWRVDLARGPVCVKRALGKLRVEADWFAPVERNVYEAEWMRRAGAAVEGATPLLLGQDPASGVLAMAFLEPDSYPLWKSELLTGEADPEFAARVATTLGTIHAKTAGDPAIARAFPQSEIFHDIRLEPYLLYTAGAHTDLADELQNLVGVTASHKLAMVHGDASPKNILMGPDGPVMLDAECACHGDPAFDVAFCLNHLLLKCLANPGSIANYMTAFERFVAAYQPTISWEDPVFFQARAARLLPGLLLGRVDGKSPVEYLNSDEDRDLVRRVARALLKNPVNHLIAVARAWRKECES